MTRLLLKLTPDSGRTDLTYFMGKLNVILSLSKALDISNECSFSLYNDQFWMLLYAATGAIQQGVALTEVLDLRPEDL